MPHLRLEYTDNLPADLASADLMRKLHEALHEVLGVRLGNCKSRVEPISGYLLGDGRDEAAFVHLDVRFLEGRPAAAREGAGDRLLRVLVEVYGGHGLDPQITVEIDEIRRRFYFKHPPGTLGSSG